MTYEANGPIQAVDYNNFSTLSTGINEIYADNHSGATLLPAAGFGYGQTPALLPVTASDNIRATQWASLFQIMRACGTHQGTSVSPPVPMTGPTDGDDIVAEGPAGSMASTLSLLQTNKFNLDSGQTSLTIGTQYSSSSNWTTLLTYGFRVDFGSWNNARYFFNSGGSLQLNGSYPGAVTPAQIAWANGLTNMSPLSFKYNSTVAGISSNDAPLNPIGFWKNNNPLTTIYQTVFKKTLGSSYYTTSSIEVSARLTATAGTNGQIEFLVSLIDGDITPDTKTFPINFRVNNAKSSGAIVYPGPAVSVTSLGFTYA